MRKVQRMKREGKKEVAESGGRGIVTQGRDGSPSGPKFQARSAVSGTGAATPRNWDACGEASLPILFEGRCRAVGAFGVYSPFSLHSHSFDFHLFGGEVMNAFSNAADS
jgi:hypothetical protein